MRMVVGAFWYLGPATWYLVCGGTRMLVFPRTNPGIYLVSRSRLHLANSDGLEHEQRRTEVSEPVALSPRTVTEGNGRII